VLARRLFKLGAPIAAELLPSARASQGDAHVG
jgi:hypothetical protein